MPGAAPGRGGSGGRRGGRAGPLGGQAGSGRRSGPSWTGGGGARQAGGLSWEAAFESHPECAAGALPRCERPALGFVPVAGAPGEDGAERSVRKLLQPLGRPAVAPRAGGTQAASRGPCAQSKCLKRETRGRALIPPGRGGPTGRRARASPAGRHLLAQVGAGAPALTVPKGSWRFAPSARSPRSGRTARRQQRAPEAAAPARPARARPPLPGLGASATGEKPKTWGGQTYRPLQQVCLSALHFRCVRDDNV